MGKNSAIIRFIVLFVLKVAKKQIHDTFDMFQNQ